MSFPEKTHTKHKPTPEDKNHFVKKSEHVGRGHNDFQHRQGPPPAQWPGPDDETGEGMDGQPAPAGQPHPFNNE